MRCGPKKTRRSRQSARKQSYDDSVTTDRQTIVMPRIPEKCFNCGASIRPEKVDWIGPNSIECPFCGQALTVPFEKIV